MPKDKIQLTPVEPADDFKSEPLFEGQNGHPLSGAEWQKFIKKLDIQTDTPEQKEQILAVFKEMLQYASGVKQIREVVNSPQPKFKIMCCRQTDAECERLYFTGYSDKEKIVIHSAELKDKEYAGDILLHELLHQRQPHYLSSHPLFRDMETQAFTRSIWREMNLSSQSFDESFAYNVREWEDIFEGLKPLPDWAIPFKANPNLTNDKWEQARLSYIKQMAAEQTAAQFMEDFLLSRAGMKRGDFSMPVYDYDGLRCHLFYDSAAMRRHIQDFTFNRKTHNYLKEKYPALNIDKLVENFNELKEEYAATKSQSPDFIDDLAEELLPEGVKAYFKISTDPNKYASFTRYHSDAYVELKNSNIQTELDRIEGRNYSETARKQFDYICQSKDISINAKLYLIVQILNKHKNIYPNTETDQGYDRYNMILKLRQLTKLDGLPIVQNDLPNGLLDNLNHNAQPLSEQGDSIIWNNNNNATQMG